MLDPAKRDSGLWNEKSALPALERSFDGYPEFVRHTELLGLSGQLSKLVRLVLLARPQAIRGTIHEYGGTVRFQLALQGIRRRGERSPTPCWTSGCEADKPELIPDAVTELAHQIVVDLGDVQGFKSPQSFRQFTCGLRHHLTYNALKQEASLNAAIDSYQEAIDKDGGNAAASCNLGDLLYSQFTFGANERAIAAYLGALQTDKIAIRARAFRGLANAMCQKRQRHNQGGLGAIEDAMRWAKFASTLCNGSALPREEQASIKKAEAYAKQVWAEHGPLDADERERATQDIVDLYCRAIDLNPRFTVAYNNVSYLYLKRAEAILDSCQAKSGAKRDDSLEKASKALQQAEKWCQEAINSERAFHMAYDNRGNIAIARARVEGKLLQAHVLAAIECYHEALSYLPSYREAYSDLAKAHSRLYSGYVNREVGSNHKHESTEQRSHHAALAWQHHWNAMTYTSDPLSRRTLCNQFADVLRKYSLPLADEIPNKDLDRSRGTDLHCACIVKEIVI